MKFAELRRMKWKLILPVLILLVGMTLVLVLVHVERNSNYERIRTRAELNAYTYASRIVGGINRGIAVTDTLEQVVISEDGKAEHFETIAANLMTDYIQSIQLAPDGVVTQIYPATGNEAGKIDLLHDKGRSELSLYAKEHNTVVMQGPFELRQGNVGIAIRNPVYLEDGTGAQQFWGFAIVIIRVPDILSGSVQALGDFGYEYEISKTAGPLESVYELVYASGGTLKDPVSYSFELGNCAWRLSVMPKAGWNMEDISGVILVCGIMIVLMAAGLSVILLRLNERRAELQRLSVTDALTELLNRSGFDAQADAYLAEYPDEPCAVVSLDLDNFKFINDLYGHAVGDNALRALADEMRRSFGTRAILGRSGGDEFCMLLKNTPKAAAQQALEAFLAQKHSFGREGRVHGFTVSMGYALYPDHAQQISALLSCADMALYEAKLLGKNRIRAYSEALQITKRTQLGFALSEVSENLPGAFLIYRADPQDDTLLFANRELIQLAGCSDLEDFMAFSGGRFRNLVHPEDYEAAEKSIWEQINAAQDGNNDYIRFRFARKDGSYHDVLDHGRIVESRHYGKVFYVLFMDCAFMERHYSTSF